MISHASVRPTLAEPLTSLPRPTITPWQRRAIEVGVAVLAFAVWGTLAYKGGFRLLARVQGMPLGGHVIIDILSLLIGVSGSIAGVSALAALAMRAAGRTPSSLFGAPDDSPIDEAYREGDLEAALLAEYTAVHGAAPAMRARTPFGRYPDA